MQVSETRRLILDAAVDASVIRGTLITPADGKRDLHGRLELNTPLEAILDTSARCPSSDAAGIGAEVLAKSSAYSAAAPAANAITNSGGGPADKPSATMTSSATQAVTGGSGAVGGHREAEVRRGSRVAGWHRTQATFFHQTQAAQAYRSIRIRLFDNRPGSAASVPSAAEIDRTFEALVPPGELYQKGSQLPGETCLRRLVKLRVLSRGWVCQPGAVDVRPPGVVERPLSGLRRGGG
jgi:hypothetical protein